LHVPPFLDGDPSLEIPLLAATEKSAQHTSIHHNGVFSVFVDRVHPPPYELLIFDQLFSQAAAKDLPAQNTTWKSICSAQIKVTTIVTGIAYVLDSFLLLATADGILWARPRNNPRSTYFVEQLEGPLTFLAANYNVVAFWSAKNTVLQVRHVKRIAVDPFIVLKPICSSTEEKSFCHGPLFLFGPYLLYQCREMEVDHDDHNDIHNNNNAEAGKEEEVKKDSAEKEKENSPKVKDWRKVDVPPSVYKKTAFWYRNRQHFLKRYGPFPEEVLAIQQKEQEAAQAQERKRLEKMKPIKQGAQFILLNYELQTKTRIQFPTALFGYGWRLLGIKMANHSHWVLTLYSHGNLMDVILQ